jgi:hypothetical protein
MNPDQTKFLLALMREGGTAKPQDLGPQISQAENSARQTCKARGWVAFIGGHWRITDAGKIAIGVSTE